MTRVSITVTSHLGDVTIDKRRESATDDRNEAANIAILADSVMDAVSRVYGGVRIAVPGDLPEGATELPPPAVKRPEWGNVALVEDLRREAATSGHPDSSFYELLYVAAERIEELSRGTA